MWLLYVWIPLFFTMIFSFSLCASESAQQIMDALTDFLRKHFKYNILVFGIAILFQPICATIWFSKGLLKFGKWCIKTEM